MNNLDTIEELDADTLSGLLNDLRRSDRHRPYAVIARAGRYVLCRGHVEALVGDEVRLLAGAPECTWEVSALSCDALAGGVQRARVGAYGWHLSADGNSLIAFGPTPPTFTIKAWGKFRVLLRGPRDGSEPGHVLGELLLDVRSPHGLEDVALCGTDAHDPRGPVGAHQRNLRRVEEILTSFAQRLAALEGPRHVDSDATRRVLDDIEARLDHYPRPTLYDHLPQLRHPRRLPRGRLPRGPRARRAGPAHRRPRPGARRRGVRTRHAVLAPPAAREALPVGLRSWSTTCRSGTR